LENRFDKLAKEWDSKPIRVQNAMGFVDKIKKYLNDDINDYEIIDYGCGSGLVSFVFASNVKKIDGYDNSKGMIEVYNKKAKKLGFKSINGILHDIEKKDLKYEQYDIAVSNMTMHHIDSMEEFILKLTKSLKPNGYLFIADLCKEDGTFHSDNEGVKHFGFEINDVKSAFKKVGLKQISVEIFQIINKPHKDFDIFFAFGII